MSIKLADVEGEYLKDLQLKRDDVLSLMEWVKQQPHLPEIIELQAILFVQSCNYDQNLAKITLDKYFTMRTAHPHIFRMKSIDDPLFRQAIDMVFLSILPATTPEGHLIVFMKLIDCNPTNYDFVYQLLYFGMSVILHLHQNGCDNGLILVYDMKGITLEHVARANFSAIRHSTAFLQEAMPIRLVGIHYINVISFIDKVMSLVKPFMNAIVRNKLHFHTSSSETLYKYVPKDCLPDEYGGKAGTISDLHEKTKQLIFGNESFFNWHNSQMVDETKREGNKKNPYGNKRTFKKLDFD